MYSPSQQFQMYSPTSTQAGQQQFVSSSPKRPAQFNVQQFTPASPTQFNMNQYHQFFCPAPMFHQYQAPFVRTPDRWQAGGSVGTQIGDYVLGTELCEGTYGIVRQAVKVSETKNGEKKMYAIKVVQASKYDENEVRLQRLSTHPNVLKVFEKFTSGELVYIVLEYCKGGDLFEYISALRRPVEEKTARVFFKQMLSALLNLHRNKIVHHDVKLENFLLAEDQSVRLCDFGTAELMEGGNELTSKYKGDVNVPEKKPGVVFNGFKADVYQLGKTIHEFMFCLMQPHPCGGINATPDYQLSPELENLLRAMLNKDPSKRPYLEEVARHPWVRGGERRPSEDSHSSQNISENESLLSSPPLTPVTSPKMTPQVTPTAVKMKKVQPLAVTPRSASPQSFPLQTNASPKMIYPSSPSSINIAGMASPTSIKIQSSPVVNWMIPAQASHSVTNPVTLGSPSFQNVWAGQFLMCDQGSPKQLAGWGSPKQNLGAPVILRI